MVTALSTTRFRALQLDCALYKHTTVVIGPDLQRHGTKRRLCWVKVEDGRGRLKTVHLATGPATPRAVIEAAGLRGPVTRQGRSWRLYSVPKTLTMLTTRRLSQDHQHLARLITQK